MTRIERSADVYVRPDNGVSGRGHRKARSFLQVRWHIVDEHGICVAGRCGHPGQRACGFVRRGDARAALAVTA